MRWRSASTAVSISSPAARSGIPRRPRARSSRRSAPTRPPRGRSTSSSSGTSRPTPAASRSASALPTRSGAPARPGSRASSSRAGSCGASRRSAAVVTSTSCRCPLCSTVLEGLNLPRYPSVPGRMRAGRKPLEATTPTRPESRLALSRLVVPAGEARQAEVLGHGPEAAAAVVDLLEQIGVAS